MCKVYIGYCGTSEIEHGLCAFTDRSVQAHKPKLGDYLSVQAHKPCSISHVEHFVKCVNSDVRELCCLDDS